MSLLLGYKALLKNNLLRKDDCIHPDVNWQKKPRLLAAVFKVTSDVIIAFFVRKRLNQTLIRLK